MASKGENFTKGEQPRGDNSSTTESNIKKIPINNISKGRFEEMKETFELIKPEMQIMSKLLGSYQLFEQDDLPAYCFELLNRRWEMNAYPQRAYFIRKIYEYVLCEQGKKHNYELDKLFKVNIGFIMEVTIVIQYLHNQIIDGKFEVGDIKSIRRNLIASNILREILFQYIQQEIESHDILEKVKKCTSNILLYVDLGQRIEQEYNHYNSYQKNILLPLSQNEIGLFSNLLCIRSVIGSVKKEIPNKANFIEAYFRRIYLTNGCFYTFMVQLVVDILDYKDEGENLSEFATAFGIATQITNDVVDFVPTIKDNNKNLSSNTVGKKSTDTYSDLKNKNITLPLIFHLSKNQDGLIETYLSEPYTTDSIDNASLDITKEIINSGAIRRTMKVGRDIADLGCNNLLKNPTIVNLIDMMSPTKWNKYYFEFSKI